jgi:hypothetical protein
MSTYFHVLPLDIVKVFAVNLDFHVCHKCQKGFFDMGRYVIDKCYFSACHLCREQIIAEIFENDPSTKLTRVHGGWYCAESRLVHTCHHACTTYFLNHLK